MKKDGRKNNGNKGHSTKAKGIDRRKKVLNVEIDGVDIFMDSVQDAANNLIKQTYNQLKENELGIKNGTYYVYIHEIEDRICYVGKGSKDRLKEPKRTLTTHSELIKSGDIQKRVIANNLNEKDALMIETALIKMINPVFNTVNKED